MNGSVRVLVENEEGGNVVLFLYMSANGDYVRCWRC